MKALLVLLVAVFLNGCSVNALEMCSNITNPTDEQVESCAEVILDAERDIISRRKEL